ncbi:MAG TPA: lipid-binding SYLF domain-containing protein [Rhodospirillales bacterium]|jgi:lipid-binding SYLF domain-containing protein|nr:lipid-binding SYLF domain-containing protein [Rhodospirillaceae bacterium]HJN23697.1 lipid-binding SYLF domain-containing protein [Rhodospirillales bacterium]|tara:strand:- start:308 stop:997 length:690 start_codon:yes stop_codon:yes gene_type:complete
MHHKSIFSAVVLIGVFWLTSCAEFRQDPVTVARNLVNRATETVERFKDFPELKEFARHIPGAKAVVVLPTVIKAGFFVGAEAGNGVLIARAGDGKWGYPVFYTLGAASFGIQAGLQDTEIVLVIRSDKAIRAILDHQGKLGADVGITVGLIGVGMEASTTANLGTDVLAFANSKLGVFGGASLEGAVLARRKDLNEAFYGAGATPNAIVLENKHSNGKADPLRAVLAAF